MRSAPDPAGMNILRRWIWVAWLPVAIVLALPAFREQISRTGARPALVTVALTVIAASIPVWLMVRSRWPRVELPLLFFLAIAPPLWRHPVAVAITIGMLLAASGFGRSVLDWMKLSLKHRAAELMFAAGIGLAAWIVVLLGSGLAHLFRAPAIAAMSILAIVFCRNGVAKIVRTFAEIVKDWSAPGAWAGIHTLLLGIGIVVLQPVVNAPSILYDALATHLASSRNFSLHHGIPPPSGYDFLPQGFELMMGAAGTLGGQAAEQMIAPLFLALFWLAVYAIARETGGTRDTSLSAATFAFAIPFIQWTGAIVKNDIGAAFFLLAALLAYLRTTTGDMPGWIPIGSFLCAAAENIKHTALVGIAPLAILFLIAAWRQRAHRFQTIALALAIFFIFGGFWIARAAWMEGDPFYPLRSPGAMEPMAAAAFHSVADRFAFLARLQFSGIPIFEGTSTTRLGPLFLLFLPALLWIERLDRRNLSIFFFTAAYLGIWLCTWPVLRYAAAPIALAAAGVAAGIARARQASPKWLGSLLMASVALCYLLNVANLSGMCLNAGRVKYLARLTDDGQYLRASLPSYAAIAWTRDHAVQGTPVFAAGTHALAYAADPVLFASPFPEEGPFSATEIRSLLAEAHYGYAILPVDFDVFGPQAPEFADANFAVYRLP
jgi:hypothetical protein